MDGVGDKLKRLDVINGLSTKVNELWAQEQNCNAQLYEQVNSLKNAVDTRLLKQFGEMRSNEGVVVEDQPQGLTILYKKFLKIEITMDLNDKKEKYRAIRVTQNSIPIAEYKIFYLVDMDVTKLRLSHKDTTLERLEEDALIYEKRIDFLKRKIEEMHNGVYPVMIQVNTEGPSPNASIAPERRVRRFNDVEATVEYILTLF